MLNISYSFLQVCYHLYNTVNSEQIEFSLRFSTFTLVSTIYHYITIAHSNHKCQLVFFLLHWYLPT
jgi:hypothetical protein